MSDHPIQGLMQTAMENIKGMVDVNTIVGEPVETKDGSVILPISKVAFGFAAGGSDFRVEDDDKPAAGQNGVKMLPFGGGSGAESPSGQSLFLSSARKVCISCRWTTKPIFSRKLSTPLPV